MKKADPRMLVLGIAAPSGTGKTTLLRAVIPLLKARGLRVALIKHTHHDLDLDRPGKDSFELRHAGASPVLLAGPRRWTLFEERPDEADAPFLPALNRLVGAGAGDLVLVEGFRGEALPKIEVYRSALGRPPLYPEDPKVLAVVSDGPPPVATDLPVLDLGDPQEVAGFIEDLWRRSAAPLEDPRRRLLRYYRWLRRYGYNDSHSGNASVRQGEGFWVTPTGSCADTLRAHELLWCPLDGDPPPGASLDAPLHRAVYRRNPQAGAVLHSHGPHSIAMTLEGGDFAPLDFEGQYHFPRVPVLSIPYERYVAEAPAAVAEVLAGQRIAVVRGHGVYAQGETLDLAYKWTCSLESSARISWLAQGRGANS